MTPPPSTAVAVLLAAADEAAANFLQPAAEILESFGIRTEWAMLMLDGLVPSLSGDVCAIIVASPDAALPAMLAAHTVLPVIRVPTPGGGRSGAALLTDGDDNLPAGPGNAVFATMAIGEPGAKNAALFVVSSLATTDERYRTAWMEFRARQTEAVLRHPPLEPKD